MVERNKHLANVAFGGAWSEEISEREALSRIMEVLFDAAAQCGEKDVRDRPLADALDYVYHNVEKGPMLVAGFQTSRFRFDGQGFQRFDENYDANTEEGSGDGPLPTLDWRKWLTRPAFEFLLDPQERYRFQYANSRDYEKLRVQLQASGRMFSDGAFLYGFGCIPNQCQKTHAAFAIRLSNGWPFYVYYDKNGQRQFGGDILSRFPERLRQFYYTGVFSP